jgi:hypothetical protein
VNVLLLANGLSLVAAGGVAACIAGRAAKGRHAAGRPGRDVAAPVLPAAGREPYFDAAAGDGAP